MTWTATVVPMGYLSRRDVQLGYVPFSGYVGHYYGKSTELKATDEQAAKREVAAHLASSTMMTAAGVAVSMPPYGWIVAAGLAVTAGTIELVRAIFHGKRNRKQIVAAAQAAGVPDAAEVPVFTARALKMSPAKLKKTADKLQKKLAKTQSHGIGRTAGAIFSMGLSEAGRRSRAKDESRLKILGAVDIIKSAVAQGKEAPADRAAQAQTEAVAAEPAPDPTLQAVGEDTGGFLGVPTAMWIGGGLLLVAVGALALYTRQGK